MIDFQQFIKSVWLKAWQGMKRWCTALAHSTFQWMKLRAWWIKSDLKEFAQWVVSVITAMPNTYWSWITLSHLELTSTHTRQVDFPFQLVWLEALTPGQLYLFPGTTALSTGCQASSGKILKAGARCLFYSSQECVSCNRLAAIFGNSTWHSNESDVTLCGKASRL